MNLVISILPEALRPYAKTVVAVLGVVLAVAAQVSPFLPENVQGYVASAVAVLAALGVYATPNTATEDPADESYSDDAADADLNGEEF